MRTLLAQRILILVVNEGCSFIFGSLWHFIAKRDRNKSGILLQNTTVLLQNATIVIRCDEFITKCNSYYKMRCLLQNALMQTTKIHSTLLEPIHGIPEL